jgi:RNA polymerase sigma-70 factor (ECF subfamily)
LFRGLVCVRSNLGEEIPGVDEEERTEALLERAASGDQEALGELFRMHRERLLRMIRMRLHPRMRGRVDASDVFQEAQLEAFARLRDFLADRPMPFFLWLRFLAGQKVVQLHRHHLGAQRRDARREVRLRSGPMPEASSASLAQSLMGNITAPSRAAMRAEFRTRLEEALNMMDPVDREVLSLRHFEQLSSAEVAQELGLKESAASKRYIRGMRKLKEILDTLPGGEGALTL